MSRPAATHNSALSSSSSTKGALSILLVSPQPFYTERGTPIAIRLLAETLIEQGHAVEMLCFHEGDDPNVRGLFIHRATPWPQVNRIGIGFSMKKLYCDAFLVCKLTALVLSRRYDVIHAGEEAIFPSIVLGRLKRLPVIYDMDSSLVDQLLDAKPALKRLAPLLTGFERFALRNSHAVMTVCEALAEKARACAPHQYIAVIEDVPIAGDTAQPGVENLRDRVQSDKPIALYVGNLAPYQGLDLLLESISLMDDATACKTVIIGGPADAVEHYRAKASSLKIDTHVDFLGARPLAHLNAYLSQADILLSPRLSGQNTPMKIYSYMHAGKAILATRIRSHEQALDESCADLVTPDARSLAQALEHLANEPARRTSLGQAAAKRVEERFSVNAFKTRVKAFYDIISGEE